MSQLFELGTVFIPYATGARQETAHLLIDETLGNKTTSDVLMALWFVFNRTAALRFYVPGILPGPFMHPLLAPFTAGGVGCGGSVVEGLAAEGLRTSEPSIPRGRSSPRARRQALTGVSGPRFTRL
ncbi:MAG: hypothetical protein M3P43_16165 [Actinomycetota bacterium]|nr:hypothetical protein [Actinomycetota bacterium]